MIREVNLRRDAGFRALRVRPDDCFLWRLRPHSWSRTAGFSNPFLVTRKQVTNENPFVDLLPMQQHAHEFNTNVALHELYGYAVKYNDQVRSCYHKCGTVPLVLSQIGF